MLGNRSSLQVAVEKVESAHDRTSVKGHLTYGNPILAAADKQQISLPVQDDPTRSQRNVLARRWWFGRRRIHVVQFDVDAVENGLQLEEMP